MNDVTAKRLLEHAGFLRALAARLVGDAARADDVVQEAWLAAMRGAPADATTHRRWLTGVVRNLARRLRREEGRRARREESVARTDYVRPTAEIAEREATRREIVNAVLALREPFRTAVLLRYYDDLPPREIARRLGVSGSTVRSRLQRGLEELRGRLDHAHDGDRRRWCLAAVPLAATGRNAAASTIALGGVLVNAKLILLVVFCAAGGLVYWSLPGTGGREDSRAAPLEVTEIAPPRPVGEPEPAVPAAPPGERAETTPVYLTGTIRGATGRVLVQASDQPIRPRRIANRVAGEFAAGPFRLDLGTLFRGASPHRIHVVARRAGYLDATATINVGVAPGDGTPLLAPVALEMRRAVEIRGTVRRADGGVVVGTLVAAFPFANGRPGEPALSTAMVEANGDFRIAVEGESEFVLVAALDGLAPAWTRAQAGATAEPLVLPAGETVTGRVTRGAGVAVGGASVSAELPHSGRPLAVPQSPWRFFWLDDRIVHATVTAAADAEGRYAIGGLEPGVGYRVSVAAAETTHYGVFQGNDGPAYVRTATPPAAGIDFELALCRVELIVTHAGKGIADAKVDATDTRPGSTYGSGWECDAEGRWLAWARPEAEFVFDVSADGYETLRVERTLPARGARVEIPVELQPLRNKATLVVKLQAEGTVALPMVVRFFRKGAHELRAVADGGVYPLRDLDPGDYELTAVAGNGDAREEIYHLPAKLRVRLAAGATEEITVPTTLGGRLIVTTRSPDGRTDGGARVVLHDDAGREVGISFAKYTASSTTVSGGRIPEIPGPAYAAEVLSAGRYRLRIEPSDAALRAETVEFQVEAGRITRLGIDLKAG